MNTKHEGSSTAGLPSCAFKGYHYTYFGRGEKQKQMPLDIQKCRRAT